jgi:hypothetical protein
MDVETPRMKARTRDRRIRGSSTSVDSGPSRSSLSWSWWTYLGRSRVCSCATLMPRVTLYCSMCVTTEYRQFLKSQRAALDLLSQKFIDTEMWWNSSTILQLMERLAAPLSKADLDLHRPSPTARNFPERVTFSPEGQTRKISMHRIFASRVLYPTPSNAVSLALGLQVRL